MIYNMPEKVTVNNAEDILKDVTSIVRKADCKREQVIIDFKDTVYISSACLRVLIVASKQSSAYNLPPVKHINISPSVMRVFNVSGLDSIFNIE